MKDYMMGSCRTLMGEKVKYKKPTCGLPAPWHAACWPPAALPPAVTHGAVAVRHGVLQLHVVLCVSNVAGAAIME